MKSWVKSILILCCLLGMGISFAYHIRLDYDSLDDIKASVHVNIEIDKEYMSSVLIIASLEDGDKFFTLSLDNNSKLRTVVLYCEIHDGEPFPPFIRKLFLYMPQNMAQETLNAIDGISIFIGNKMFYFTHSDVASLQSMEQNGYILYELHGLEYEKSITAILLKMPQWINWYGDFNLAVKAVSAFFIHPEKYIITWCFIFCFLILCWSNIKNIYTAIQKQKLPLLELLLLGFIILTGFILRINDYVRYSSWGDELYSACQASNPNQPFINTFEDPGNPPFYYILLRFWFILFGWTEQSGRLLSVLTGCAAIVSLYIFVKRFADKKSAILVALYTAVNFYFIGFSQEMRAYILEVFLVSIVAHRFLIILQERKLRLKIFIWYIIPSILLVNTHYFGSLFIFATFLFYIVYSVKTKTFTWNKTILFFTGNILIASSLLPFFIHTAFQNALLDSSFNTFIRKPGLTLICITAFIPLFGILYIYLRKTILKKILSKVYNNILDYSLFVTASVYLIAFGISLYRPILTTTYLIILYPLLFAIVAIVLINVFTNSSKLIGGLCIGFAFIWIAGGYETERGGNTGVYKESQSYISKDAEAHFQNISMETSIWVGKDASSFYGYKELPLFAPGDNYDVLYFRHIRSEKHMYSETVALGISAEKVLRIHVNTSRSIFKIYR